ncbi:unnamed protein product, partial [Coffea canephora]
FAKSNFSSPYFPSLFLFRVLISNCEIHVIVGPIFAGKTSTLLRRIKTESSNGNYTCLGKSHIDNSLVIGLNCYTRWRKIAVLAIGESFIIQTKAWY